MVVGVCVAAGATRVSEPREGDVTSAGDQGEVPEDDREQPTVGELIDLVAYLKSLETTYDSVAER